MLAYGLLIFGHCKMPVDTTCFYTYYITTVSKYAYENERCRAVQNKLSISTEITCTPVDSMVNNTTVICQCIHIYVRS